MEINTEHKKVKIVFSTRKLVKLTKELNGKNFENIWFKAMNNSDIEALATIILEFAENEAGVKSFKTIDEVYDFIDDYKEEKNKSYKDIFDEMAGAINDEGFFYEKMKEEELKDKIKNPLSAIDIDMEALANKAAEKAADQAFMQQA